MSEPVLKAQREERTKRNKEYRLARFQRLLGHPDIIALRQLGDDGYRIIHFEWPQSNFIDFWPTICTYRRSDGRTGKWTWIRLLKRLGIARGDLENGEAS